MNRSYLGQGIKFPLSVDNYGKISLQSDLQLVRQSIVRILNTPVGSCFMNRDFGSHIYDLQFEPNDDILKSLLDYFITDAVEKWEGRVELLDVSIYDDAKKPEQVNCSVTYKLKQSEEIDSFIYPFYKELQN